MKNYDELKWYVLIYDFNTDKIDNFNIFRNSNLRSKRIGIDKLLKQYVNLKILKKN